LADLELLSEEKGEIRFLLKDSNYGLANGLRRTLLTKVPKLAIDDVVLYENSSALFDEILAHRLGMLPIEADISLYVFRSECICEGEGCPNCTAIFTLTKEGPCTVYSKDLQGQSSEAKIADPGIPIVELLGGQRLILECSAILGVGKMHAKWQAVNGLAYKNYPTIEVGECNLCGACIEACPKKILDIKDQKLEVLDILRCSLCSACEEACEKYAIKVGYDPRTFIFKYETDGSIGAKEILRKALEIIEKEATAFANNLPKRS
jgi:DNA-directed RNA polymerase subunit D